MTNASAALTWPSVLERDSWRRPWPIPIRCRKLALRRGLILGHLLHGDPEPPLGSMLGDVALLAGHHSSPLAWLERERLKAVRAGTKGALARTICW